ncbi:hypothetical protein PFICI_05514 [Pestalotiopsis fici W106-1]|uniref:C2H2-type domain-containing protein n=1 Tax=Pestalotiopsis fici (strain W106-1 / CGMCC3.15140) TaxID=1229662 RepID=W3XC24_PESFW|nr:uncharacterized protein PFICI_05514 [Pestalotiopsis fici W106-1]ETS83638.1 hypothetical protein PFICI_05514 [Pestalotiopsis fici W106-1]
MAASAQSWLPIKDQFVDALRAFKQRARLSSSEELEFSMTSLDDLKLAVRKMESDQESRRCMMNLKRLDPFLKSMEEYGKLIEIFVNVNEVVAFVWGPMKFILQVASTHAEALHCILDAYQEIGEQIPLLASYQSLFAGNDHMGQILKDIYTDILEFHRETLRHFKSKVWKQLFRATWKGFNLRLKMIKDNLTRHKHLIESRASLIQFEEVKIIRQQQEQMFQLMDQSAQSNRFCEVMEWLSPFLPDGLQDSYKEISSICPDAGRWLLEHPKVKDWLLPQYCTTPLLWLNGIPGAGKTILASLVVDKVKTIPEVSVSYFYFKFRDQTRNSMLSAAKSITAQLLREDMDGDLLYQFYDNKSSSGSMALTSPDLAKEMLHQALEGKSKTKFIILDGLDECERSERRTITAWFQEEAETLIGSDPDSIRIMFVSQDDGVGRRDLAQVPMIRVSSAENKEDIKAFAEKWQQRIEERFGNLHARLFHITNIILGMFIFARLFAEYLFNLGSPDQLKQELNPERLPVELDDLYDRILYRITDSRPEPLSAMIRKVLGWIVAAQRPLRWRELQGAISVDLETQDVNFEKRLLDSPDILFASLVQQESDDSITLIHSTAKEYLRRTNFVQWRNPDHSLAILSLAYLNLPPFDPSYPDENISNSILTGFYSYAEYALSCWALDVATAVGDASQADDLSNLVDTLDVFIPMHWEASSRMNNISASVKRKFIRFEKADCYDDLLQAASWMEKQLEGPDKTCLDEAPLRLMQVIKSIREVFEQKIEDGLTDQEQATLIQYYGASWFKCPRLNCYYFHQGFKNAGQRKDHVNRHERPFLCTITNCHSANFGFAAKNELERHMLDFHGFDMSNADEFPKQQLRTAPHSSTKNARDFKCELCNKTFTQKHNLVAHVRVHNSEKPYQCTLCDKKFTRKRDCNRHERGHGEKESICFGELDDGTTWGCKASFGRADTLAAHLRSKAGRECMRPVILREQELNAKDISLMPFAELLRICGLSPENMGISQSTQ